MHSKQIAIEYLAPKISDPTMIFKDINIFKSILPWAKDSARELFATEKSKMFLTQYIDDIAPIVDEYLISKVNKMYKKAMKSQNKLFTNLCSSEKTVAWIIDRWINVFVNLSWDSRYKNHVDLSKIKFYFNNEIDFTHNSLEDILEFEKLQKFPKNEIIKALKFIWEDGYFDYTLDSEDIDYLCKKFDLTIKDVFGTDDLVKLNLKKEQTESGHSQLVLFFT